MTKDEVNVLLYNLDRSRTLLAEGMSVLSIWRNSCFPNKTREEAIQTGPFALEQVFLFENVIGEAMKGIDNLFSGLRTEWEEGKA